MGRGRAVDAERAREALAAGDLAHLTRREREVLTLRAAGLSMSTLAGQLGISRERARQLQSMGLRILRATKGRRTCDD